MSSPINSPFQQHMVVAQSLAKDVGREIRQIVESSRPVTISHKGVSDLVTEVDVWSEKLITERVNRDFPGELVIGEETSQAFSEARGLSLPELVAENTCWIVDPLDGTTNFSNRIPYCAISIGVTVNGIKKIGVVYDPFKDELFAATAGCGATLNGAPIKVGEKDKLIDSVAATGFPNDRWQRWKEYQPTIEALIMSCRNVRSYGAAAIDLCWVACGRFDAFLEFNLKPWDVAAGALIIEEAGGRLKSFGNKDGEPFSLFARAFAASGKNLFDPLIETVSPTLAGF